MVDLASQNFQDIRPLLTEYKQVAEQKNVTIPQEFARREAMAREVLSPTLPLHTTNSPGSSKDTQARPHNRL